LPEHAGKSTEARVAIQIVAGAKGAYQRRLVEGELLKLIAAIVQHELTCIWAKEVRAMGKNTNRNLRNRRRKQKTRNKLRQQRKQQKKLLQKS
jgi:hypothetical protein